MRRPLPSLEETRAILGARRTRPAPRPPPPAGRSLSKFIKALDDRFGQGPGVLQARWREIVGEALAQRTEPSKLVKGRAGQPGVLEIRVQGAAATLIQHQSADILERVGLFLGPDAVGRLRIVQGPVKPKSAVSAAPHPRRRAAPLDAAIESELASSLKGTPDGSLKEALVRLGRAVLGERHGRR